MELVRISLARRSSFSSLAISSFCMRMSKSSSDCFSMIFTSSAFASSRDMFDARSMAFIFSFSRPSTFSLISFTSAMCFFTLSISVSISSCRLSRKPSLFTRRSSVLRNFSSFSFISSRAWRRISCACSSASVVICFASSRAPKSISLISSSIEPFFPSEMMSRRK